ncbi:transglutaminase family protein [Oryzifoliimicrobium ureilyticus]|uniref:transglutaminase family protein n=1 Tax=Oryzifoliimicrobium ureilyticus TaxID=3113724 RepID=UPI0030763CB1
MPMLSIHHLTTYSFREDVSLSPHRLMLRPREGRELRLLSHHISTIPEATLNWSIDVFGNAIAGATFQDRNDSLVVESSSIVDLSAVSWPVFHIAASAINYPFLYTEDDWTDLGALAAQQYNENDNRLEMWARRFIAGRPTDTLALLKDISLGIASSIFYQSREEEGTQTPLATLDRGWGSCRDFAVLFVEAVRSLGFGARIVSGYLFNPNGSFIGCTNQGSTHAWSEVYVPGAGWIAFDPTNRAMGGANLIPVAVTRDIGQAVPVSGGFVGGTNAFVSMTVGVEVKMIDPASVARL